MLFSGTMRYNLDPFDQYPDGELWNVLEQVGVFSPAIEQEQETKCLLCCLYLIKNDHAIWCTNTSWCFVDLMHRVATFVYKYTLFPRLSAAAFIFSYCLQVQRLFKGGVY